MSKQRKKHSKKEVPVLLGKNLLEECEEKHRASWQINFGPFVVRNEFAIFTRERLHDNTRCACGRHVSRYDHFCKECGLDLVTYLSPAAEARRLKREKAAVKKVDEKVFTVKKIDEELSSEILETEQVSA